MINLKWEFDEIIREFGHPVILIRTYKGKDCNCVTELSQSANPKCPVCFGTGKINSSEVIKIRNVTKYSLMNYKFAEMGQTIASPNTIYISSDVRPCVNDLIIQCAFKDGKPFIDEYSQIYLIDNVAPLRAENGEIAFFTCTTESQPKDKMARLNNILDAFNKTVLREDVSGDDSNKQLYEIIIANKDRYIMNNDFSVIYNIGEDDDIEENPTQFKRLKNL